LNPKTTRRFFIEEFAAVSKSITKMRLQIFNQAIKLNDDDWRTYSNRSLASLQLDRYVDVISDCNKVISLEKRLPTRI